MSGGETPDARPATGGDWLRYLGTLASAAVERFPAATLFVLLFALAANRTVAVPTDPGIADWRLLFALLGASAAATAVQLALEVRRTGAALRLALPTLAGILVGAVVFGSAVALVEVPLLIIGAMLAVPLAPFLLHGRDGEGYWTFFLWGSAGAALAFVAVMVSISGLTTALELFRLFFGIGLSFEAYAHIYVTAFGLVGPMFALASLPATGAAGPRFSIEDRLIRLVRPLLVWIAPALLLLQGAVLHLYAPLALFGDEGLLDAALLSTSFLIGVVTLRILFQPFRDDPAPLARLFRWFWLWLFPVPILLIGVALAVAVPRTGMDEIAYMAGAVALAAILIALAQRIPSLSGDIVSMAAVTLIFVLAAAVGPLSLANVVSRSQASLVENRYADALSNGEPLDERERRDLRRAVTLLVEFEQVDRLAPLVGEDAIAGLATSGSRSSSLVADRLLAMLGAPSEMVQDAPAEEALRVLESNSWSPVAVGPFDTVLPSVSFEVGETYPLEVTDPALRVDGTVLTIRFGTDVDRVDLAPMIAAMPVERFNAGRGELPLVELTTEGGRPIGIRPGYVSVDAADRPAGGHVTLLMRARDWSSLGSE